MKKPLSNPTRFVKSLIPIQPRWSYPTPIAAPVNFYTPHTPVSLYQAPVAPTLPIIPVAPVELPTLYEAPALPTPEPEPLATLYEAPAPPAPKPDPLATLYEAPAPPAPEPEPLATLYEAPAPPAPEPEPLATLYEAPAPPAHEPDHSNIDMVEEQINSMMQMDASYSFKYDNEFSSREETADPSGNVKGCSKYCGRIETYL